MNPKTVEKLAGLQKHTKKAQGRGGGGGERQRGGGGGGGSKATVEGVGLEFRW